MRFSNRFSHFSALICCIATLSAQSGKPRIISYAPNRPIAEQLLPDDTEVEVVQHGNVTVYSHDPTPEEELIHLLREHPGAAVVMNVAQVNSVLIEDGTWIETVLEGLIVETLTAGTPEFRATPFGAGERVTASTLGGALMIGKVRVRTQGSLSFPENSRYLVFLGKSYTNPQRFRVSADPLLIRNNRLVAVPGDRNKLAGLTLDRVKRLAKQVRK